MMVLPNPKHQPYPSPQQKLEKLNVDTTHYIVMATVIKAINQNDINRVMISCSRSRITGLVSDLNRFRVIKLITCSISHPPR